MRRATLLLVLLAACGGGSDGGAVVTTPPSPTPAIDALALGEEAETPRGGTVTVLGWAEVERDEAPPAGTAWSYAEIRYCQPPDSFGTKRGTLVAFFRLDMPEGADVHPVERAEGDGELATGQSQLLTECMEGNVVFAHPAGRRPVHVLFTVGELAWAVA